MHGDTHVYYGNFGRVAALRPGNNLVPHAHREAHIVIQVSGATALAMIGEQSVLMTGGTGVAINPLTIHSFQLLASAGSVVLLTFYINPDWLKRHCGLSTTVPFQSARICLDEGMLDTAQLLLEAIELGDSMDDTIGIEIALFLESLVALAIRPDGDEWHSAERLRPDYRVRKAMVFMEQNLDARCTLEQVARSAGLSRPHFFSLFHEQTILTPRIYWNLLRIENAIAQIRQAEGQLGTVAYNLGFSSQGNFSRFFREHIGVSPMSFRRAVQQTDFALSTEGQ
jgi:AraC family transcriptional regulator